MRHPSQHPAPSRGPPGANSPAQTGRRARAGLLASVRFASAESRDSGCSRQQRIIKPQNVGKKQASKASGDKTGRAFGGARVIYASCGRGLHKKGLFRLAGVASTLEACSAPWSPSLQHYVTGMEWNGCMESDGSQPAGAWEAVSITQNPPRTTTPSFGPGLSFSKGAHRDGVIQR